MTKQTHISILRAADESVANVTALPAMPTTEESTLKMGKPHDFFKDISLVTRAFLELKGLPVPERYEDITPEELAPIKEKVASALGAETNTQGDKE